MITLDDLNQAIKECEGQRNPTANTALKLAAFYTIKNELYPASAPELKGYSYSPPPTSGEYASPTDFGQAVSGKDTGSVYGIIDDLMSLLQTAQPRLHRKIIEKIQDI